MPAQSAQNIVLGLMTWGKEGTSGARVHDIKDCEKMLDVFVKHGHNEVDSARVYCGGTSEEYLGQIDWKSRGIIVDTKLFPFPDFLGKPIKHTEECIREHIEIQLANIKTECIDMWYLHGPDRSTPYEETLRVVNDLYKEGKFKRFGISNYMSWEVAEMVGICEKNGWIKPTAYQGLYNALHRNVEPELFPCLRKFGISFYEFNPLGGGFFTGQYEPGGKSVEKGSRFDAETGQGKLYRQRYWNDNYFKALELIGPVANKFNLSLAEVALRWISHHSLLSREKGDAVLIGASSVGHLESNLIDLEKGPLPEEVVKALDEAWDLVRPVASKGDDGDVAPAPKPAPKAAATPSAAAPVKAAAPAKQDRAPRNNNNRRAQGPREVNADVPAPGQDAKEDRAKNIARAGGRGRGPRGPGGNPRGNSGTYQGGNRPRRENGGGRPFDRQSQTGRVDSEKAEAAGWGADEGKKELEAEVLAEGDAKEEQAATGTATPVREAPVEEEDNTQTYEQYLAAQAEKKLNIAALPEARKANEGVDDAQWGNATAISKKGEAEEEWLMGAPKVASNKTKAKKEKIFLEIDAPIRKPTENSRGGRGGRGGARGRGEGRGRGGARGGAARGPRQAAPAVPDASAFPALA
ncbi:hypothetical protein JCM3765_002705 [Sporobolomyces pararoseus]